MTHLSTRQQQLHSRALQLSARFRSLESEIVFLLGQIEKEKVFKLLGFGSLFDYAVKALGLSSANAYSFILVSRKCREIPSLRLSIENKQLSVSKASRMVSVLSKDNAEELVQFARKHTSREIDRKVTHLRPRSKVRDQVKDLSEEWAKLECSLSKPAATKLKRAQSLLSSKLGRMVDFNETLDAVLNIFLEKHDPLEKAKRAQKREKAKSSTNLGEKEETPKEKRASPFCPGKRRTPLSAGQKHTVYLRDQGQCTFVNPQTGERCSNERWLHTHHIKSVKDGGSHHPDNLTILCALHHDLVHQLSLPLENQMNWIREPSVAYGVWKINGAAKKSMALVL